MNKTPITNHECRRDSACKPADLYPHLSAEFLARVSSCNDFYFDFLHFFNR